MASAASLIMLVIALVVLVVGVILIYLSKAENNNGLWGAAMVLISFILIFLSMGMVGNDGGYMNTYRPATYAV